MEMTIEQLKIKKMMDSVELAFGSDTGIRTDNWNNLVSGIGTVNDKDNHNVFAPDLFLETDNPNVIDALCRKDRLARKICEVPIKDAIKNGYVIANDASETIHKKLLALGFNEALERAGIDCRKFGSGVLLLCTKGESLETPIKGKNEITKIINYTNLDFRLDAEDKVVDFESEYFNDYEYLRLKQINGEEVSVHRSRLLIMKGRLVGTTTNATNVRQDLLYWGDSELSGVYDSIGRYAISLKSAGSALQELNVSVLALEGLGDLLSSMSSEDDKDSKEANAKFQMRLQAMAQTKSVVNMVFLDAENEKLTNKSIVLAGIPEVINVLQMDLSGKTDIPITKLFGRSPAGENSTGESDTANYNSMVMDVQLDMKPLIQKCVNYITGDTDVEKHAITFNHPTPPTQKEKREQQKTMMDIITGYTKEGVLDVSDVRDFVLHELGLDNEK